MIKVLITGPILPPAGGISIHIARLNDLLKDEFQFDFIDESAFFKDKYFNIRSLNLLYYLQKAIKTDIFFIHSGNNLFKNLHILIAKILRKKIIITIHGYRNRKNWLFRNLDKYVYELSDKIILVNNEILQRIPLNKSSGYIIKNAFLPPVMENEKLSSFDINKWIENVKKNQSLLLCANASRLDLHDNEDLYGLDMCIEVMRRLIVKKYKISLIFVVTSLDKGLGLFYKYVDLIRTYHLEEYILLINENISFVKIIEQSDIVLRPTNTDGDAITIREAHYLNKIVLASDVVKRPDGTYLFKKRDFDDFELQLENRINHITKQQSSINHNRIPNTNDFKKFYVDLINSVMEQ